MSTSIHKAADAAAAVSIPTWLVTFASDWEPVLRFGVGVLAGIASVFAIIVKYYEWRALRERR